MLNYKTKQWCEKAVSEIVFPPDKWKVYQELADHIYDHYDYLIEQGYEKDLAIERTFEAMGDAHAIAHQLGLIHRPFWGYFLRATRILLIITFVMMSISLTALVYDFISYVEPTYDEPEIRYDPYMDSYVSDDVGVTTRLMYQEPQQRIKCDGYTLELTRVAWSHTQFVEPGHKDLNSFNFQIEITNPLPWADDPNIIYWIWAKDSEGNIYYPMTSGLTGTYLLGNMIQTAPLTWTLDMWTSGFSSQNAEWFDIYYDRDGRNIKFRVYLSGGDAQ